MKMRKTLLGLLVLGMVGCSSGIQSYPDNEYHYVTKPSKTNILTEETGYGILEVKEGGDYNFMPEAYPTGVLTYSFTLKLAPGAELPADSRVMCAAGFDSRLIGAATMEDDTEAFFGTHYVRRGREKVSFSCDEYGNEVPEKLTIMFSSGDVRPSAVGEPVAVEPSASAEPVVETATAPVEEAFVDAVVVSKELPAEPELDEEEVLVSPLPPEALP